MTGIYETFGKYKLTERIAFGGMAEVFLGTVHGEAGFIKPVVIKRLHPRLSEDSEFVQMLIDEARITAQLTHSNICQVLDLGSVDGSYYIAMEYISGEDLRTIQDHLIRRKQAMPVEAALYIMSEVAAGLDYAHRKTGADGKPLGIVHRDISPQNVLVSYEGEVKVIDFGIAKARSKVVQTEAGVIKGKFRYMSPEQASGTKIDHRTDIFAAGVVLYELLQGRPHSTDVGDTEVLRRMRLAEFDPLRRQRPEVSAKLEKAVRRALSLKVGGRYATAEAFRAALLKQQQLVGIHYGRAELAGLMNEIFDAERRQRRSPSYGESMEPVQPAKPVKPVEPVEPGPGRMDGASAPRRRLPTQADAAAALEATTLAQSSAASSPPLDGVPGDDDATHAFFHLDEKDLDPLEEVPTMAQGTSERRTVARDTSGLATRAQDPSQCHTIAQDPSQRRTIAQDPSARSPAQPYRSRVGAGAFQRQQTQAVRQEIHKDPTNMLQDPGQVQTRITAAGAMEQQVATDLTRGPSDRSGGSALKVVVGVLLLLLLGGGLAAAYYHFDRSKALGGAERVDAAAAAAPDLGAGIAVPSSKARRRPTLGRLKVKSRPSNAAIILCGLDTGKVTPATVPIRVGRRCTLELHLEEHESYKLSVVARRGKPINIVASLRRRAPRGRPVGSGQGVRPKPRPRLGGGTLRVTSIQVGTVYVNGKRAGRTPRIDLSLQPGSYSVKVFFPSLEQYTPTRQVTVRAGKISTVHFDPS